MYWSQRLPLAETGFETSGTHELRNFGRVHLANVLDLHACDVKRVVQVVLALVLLIGLLHCVAHRAVLLVHPQVAEFELGVRQAIAELEPRRNALLIEPLVVDGDALLEVHLRRLVLRLSIS